MNVSVEMGLVALLLASGAQAQNITLDPQVTGTIIGTGYIPKLASDGQNGVATIAGTGTGLSAFESLVGVYKVGWVSWAASPSNLYSPPQTTPQIGLAPSIALAYEAAYPNYDNAIEVHQGGQDSGSSLWFQLGSKSSPSSKTNINWLAANFYDTGYNPTVAADLNGSSTTSTTVVEVHQAGTGVSALWYHVGTLTLGASPSMSSSWGTAQEINGGMNQGYAPTVSVANNLAILVAQGTGGALWYSIGVVDTATSTINWTQPIPYGTTGYNPTVSVFGDGSDFDTDHNGARIVVEAHQVNSGTGPLSYRTGVLNKGAHGSAPTSITWTPDADTPYSTGCYPSVALAFYGYTPSSLGLTETHETACGTPATVVSSFSTILD